MRLLRRSSGLDQCVHRRETGARQPTDSHGTQLEIDEFCPFQQRLRLEGQTYKQIHGCAMGSSVSPIVTNICIKKTENMAIKTSHVPSKTWKRFVDNSFTIIQKNAAETYRNTLNLLDRTTQFTLKHGRNL